MSQNNPLPGEEKAARHAAQAREYRRLAQVLREQAAAPEAAGILLYEAAKQCINALANQQGDDPRATAAKVYFLRHWITGDTGLTDPVENWRAADRLHINADRLHLAPPEFNSAWEKAQTFIDQMLAIYAGGG